LVEVCLQQQNTFADRWLRQVQLVGGTGEGIGFGDGHEGAQVLEVHAAVQIEEV